MTNLDARTHPRTTTMPKKKPPKDTQDDVDAICKLLCDEARNHMKVRNYTKALNVYNKVSVFGALVR